MTESGLVSARWLLDNYQQDNIRILDASMDATVIFPDTWQSGPVEFEQAHIPGARYFDIDKTSDTSSGLPHTLPRPEVFQSTMRSLGINAGDHVIVYDNSLLRSAARGWWMLRVMGHARVSVLDGGLEAWKQAGGPLETGAPRAVEGDFEARFQPELFRSKSGMLDIVERGGPLIVDARGAPRFNGEVSEPRPGLASGHIPGAVNVPFSSLYTADGLLRPKNELKSIFARSGVNAAQTLVTSCGSGVTACNLALALHELGNDRVAVYDGSWVEWGSSKDVPIETGVQNSS